MSHLRATSLAGRSSLLNRSLSRPYLHLQHGWCTQNYRQMCSASSRQNVPNISNLYKALTKPFPAAAPDPKLTSLMQSAQTTKDPNAAVKALTSNVTTVPIHHTHVTTTVQLCLPSNPQLAQTLLSTLTGTIPQHALTPARAILARYYTSRNDPKTALATICFPIELLSESPVELRAHIHSLHLGNTTTAWGVVIKSLVQLNYPSHACVIADEAIRSRVPVTDALLHLCIDALRADNRWEHANSLFESATTSGLPPSERTVGSLLLALTSRSARAQVDRTRVIEVVDMIQSPSIKFLNVALMALTSVGAIARAERVFVELVSDGIVEEHMFSKMLAGLGNFLELLPVEDVDRIDASTYAGIAERGDQLWDEYLQRYPRGQQAGSILSKVVRLKTRCFRQGEGVDVLEQLAESDRSNIVRMTHVAALMGAIELSCNVEEMKRLLKVMEKLGLKHDMRSLAFCLGTLIGDGNLTEAVSMVREEAGMAIENNQEILKQHYPTLLLRRLKTLTQALYDAGVGRIVDLEEVVALVQRKQYDYRGKEVYSA